MKWSRIISVVFLVIIFAGCEEDEIQQRCLLERIQFDALNSLKFTTISGGLIYQVSQDFLDNGELRSLVTFQFVYFQDSIIVRNLTEPSNNVNFPHLWMLTENGRPTKVVRYFNQSAVRLIHTFDYSREDRLRITLDRIASNGAFLNAGYGDYFFDEAGNVIRLQTYGINPENSDEIILTSDQEYTYDGFVSPLKGLILPFFNATNIADPRYFSNNNVLSVTQNNLVSNHQYRYGDSDQPIVEFQPNGSPIFFTYLNCDE